jgi:hypothetical protein
MTKRQFTLTDRLKAQGYEIKRIEPERDTMKHDLERVVQILKRIVFISNDQAITNLANSVLSNELEDIAYPERFEETCAKCNKDCTDKPYFPVPYIHAKDYPGRNWCESCTYPSTDIEHRDEEKLEREKKENKA